jgi:hypothetical protein
MFLQIVAFATDIARDFKTVRQAYAGNLAHGGVRLFRRRCVNARAHTTLLRAGV